MDIDIGTLSPLHSSGNGLAECGVREVKDVLKKNSPLKGPELQKYLFEMNTRLSSLQVQGPRGPDSTGGSRDGMGFLQ